MPKGFYTRNKKHLENLKKIGFKKGNQLGKMNKGNKMSEEQKELLSELHKNTVGKNCPNYKDGRCSDNNYIIWIKNKRNRMKRNADGSHTYQEWSLLKKQYDYTCPCCKKKEPMIKLTEDHIIPISKGGSDYIENIQPLCGSCNSVKHTSIIKY